MTQAMNNSKKFVGEKEKKHQPQVNRARIFKMPWVTIVILIFLLIVQLFVTWELYKNWKNTIKNIDIPVGRHEKVSNVAKRQFDNYLKDFKKSYKHEEYMRRFKNFQESLKEIAILNKLENNTVFGLTKFSDMSKEEFVNRMLSNPFQHGIRLPCQTIHKICNLPNISPIDQPRINKHYDDLPGEFDWRSSKGVVKPVMNQKLCQGCWAFSIVGVLESMSAIQLTDFRRRSIQELLDCSPDTFGCFNGSVTKAMFYMCEEKLQFVTEDEYPLTLAIDKICKLKPGYSGIRVKQYAHFCNMDEDDMVKNIRYHGPLIAAVDSSNWQNYMGGVITRACTRGVANHVVQVVGYEGYKGPTENTPIPYYIVRNSFGEDFGDKGYVKIAMKNESMQLEDVCGIAEQVTLMDVMQKEIIKTTGV